jgi:hypothetical protein
MATATQKLRAARRITGRADAVPAVARREYRCTCGQGLHVFGLGRHQVYFEPSSARLQDPVIAHACPHCGRGLPGSNPD